jgi:hypothetical protein
MEEMTRKYPPYTAQEWWEFVRDQQLDLAMFYHDRLHPEHRRVWECLFLWATPDLWRDPE